MKNNILVSICSITYNHAPYIRQCLDGMLMQQTNFDFEIIINDDCSTDGTTEIIREYADKYPDIIKPIFHEENQYKKGVRGMFNKFVFPKAQGKYIAMCEGDDYWTDSLKLQKQVDFLESYPEYSVCFHRCQVYSQKDEIFKDIVPHNFQEGFSFDIEFFISRCAWITNTLTCVFRYSVLKENTGYFQCKESKDLTLFYFLLKNKKGFLLPEVMAVYRVHSGGIWSRATEKQRIFTDLKTIKNIYDVEHSALSEKLLKNYIDSTIKLGFLINNCCKLNIYFKVIKSRYGIPYIYLFFVRKVLNFISYNIYHKYRP